jgi:hypothetical protein
MANKEIEPTKSTKGTEYNMKKYIGVEVESTLDTIADSLIKGEAAVMFVVLLNQMAYWSKVNPSLGQGMNKRGIYHAIKGIAGYDLTLYTVDQYTKRLVSTKILSHDGKQGSRGSIKPTTRSYYCGLPVWSCYELLELIIARLNIKVPEMESGKIKALLEKVAGPQE